MLQEADCGEYFLARKSVIALGSLVLAGGLLLMSCTGGGGGKTRLVEHRYLTANGDLVDAGDGAVGDLEGESEFARQQREMFGAGVVEGAPSASLDDFVGALDNYLIDAANAESQLAIGDGGGASEVRRPAVQGVNPKATEAVEKPRVMWQRNVERVQPTPADRAELIGTAKTGMQSSLTPTGPEVTESDAPASRTRQYIEANVGIDEMHASNGRKAKAFSLDEIIVMLSAKLHQNAGRSNMPLREHMADAAMLMLDPTRRINVNELYGLNAREREILSDLQEFFIDVAKQLRETKDAEAIIEAVNKLSRGLGSVGNLEIPTIRLCTSVNSFGAYEEIESLTFVRGRQNRVITYIEVVNFEPRMGADGLYKTTLTQESELFTYADGTLADSQPAVTAVDYCRNIRNDFYLIRKWTLPANLSVGTYNLKVRVTDEASNQEAEAVVRIEIVASKTYR